MIDRGFKPDWASPPGDTIMDLMVEEGIDDISLSILLGVDVEELRLLLEGKLPITEDLAQLLAHVLGSTEGFWLRREANYRKRAIKLSESDL